MDPDSTEVSTERTEKCRSKLHKRTITQQVNSNSLIHPNSPILLHQGSKGHSERAEPIRASFESPLLKDLKVGNETLSDEEFESQLKKTEIGLKKAALLNKRDWPGDPASWGLN